MVLKGLLNAGLIAGRPANLRKRSGRVKIRRGKFANDLNRDAYDASRATYGGQESEKALADRGYIKDPELTGKNFTTYTRNDEAIVAFRGTAALDDLAPDLGILTNDFTGRDFVEAKSLVDRASKKYNLVTTTGHSLGGTKALKSSGGNVKAIAFNPGTGTRNLDTGDNQVFKTNLDPISGRVKGRNVTTIGGGHSLNDFEGNFY
jgi:hypothetical protein